MLPDTSEWTQREYLKQVVAGPHSLVAASLREPFTLRPTPIEQWVAAHAP